MLVGLLLGSRIGALEAPGAESAAEGGGGEARGVWAEGTEEGGHCGWCI